MNHYNKTLLSQHLQLTTLFDDLKNDTDKNLYVKSIVNLQYKMLEHLDIDFLMDLFLSPVNQNDLHITQQDIVLTACLKNENELDNWLDHYRTLGVTKFLLVDDNSNSPIIPQNDVWVYKPKRGLFRYAKAFWLELLLRRYALGLWSLTVDGDEYLDVPTQSIASLVENTSVSYFSAVLLDMLPNPNALVKIQNTESLHLSDFDRVIRSDKKPNLEYVNYPGNKWYYDKLTDKVYKLDARYHLNNAFNCLRKIPLFQMDKNIHLNQGFHDLIIGNQKRSHTELTRSDLLGIRHYKLFNVYVDNNDDPLRPHEAYYLGSINLVQLRKNIKNILMECCSRNDTIAYTDIQNVSNLLK